MPCLTPFILPIRTDTSLFASHLPLLDPRSSPLLVEIEGEGGQPVWQDVPSRIRICGKARRWESVGTDDPRIAPLVAQGAEQMHLGLALWQSFATGDGQGLVARHAPRWRRLFTPHLASFVPLAPDGTERLLRWRDIADHVPPGVKDALSGLSDADPVQPFVLTMPAGRHTQIKSMVAARLEIALWAEMTWAGQINQAIPLVSDPDQVAPPPGRLFRSQRDRRTR